MADGDWFDNVENLRPVRGGRRAKTLNAVARPSRHVTSGEAEAKFRADWEAAHATDDPLGALWQYVVWFDEQFPAGRASLLYPMLYKCCVTYGCDARYQHDERLLKFWSLLAESFPERGLAVFEFAYTQGSLRTMAKFYVRWSDAYDTCGNANKSREILDLGFHNNATPLAAIQDARRKLEMRLLHDSVVAQRLNDSNYDLLDMDCDEPRATAAIGAPPPLSARKALGRLRGVGEAAEAPMFRLATSPGTLRTSQTPSQSLAADSFEIFADEPTSGGDVAVAAPTSAGSIADEFAHDPEYQALFGFFEHKPKPGCHLNISENLRRAQGVQLTPLKWNTLTIEGDDFEVYDEASTAARKAALRSKNAQGTADSVGTAKPRLCLKRQLIAELSIEEAYAAFINASNSNCAVPLFA